MIDSIHIPYISIYANSIHIRIVYTLALLFIDCTYLWFVPFCRCVRVSVYKFRFSFEWFWYSTSIWINRMSKQLQSRRPNENELRGKKNELLCPYKTILMSNWCNTQKKAQQCIAICVGRHRRACVCAYDVRMLGCECFSRFYTFGYLYISLSHVTVHSHFAYNLHFVSFFDIYLCACFSFAFSLLNFFFSSLSIACESVSSVLLLLLLLMPLSVTSSFSNLFCCFFCTFFCESISIVHETDILACTSQLCCGIQLRSIWIQFRNS